MHTKFLSENLKGKDQTVDLIIDGKIMFEWVLGKLGGKVWYGCSWLRIVTSGGFL